MLVMGSWVLSGCSFISYLVKLWEASVVGSFRMRLEQRFVWNRSWVKAPIFKPEGT